MPICKRCEQEKVLITRPTGLCVDCEPFVEPLTFANHVKSYCESLRDSECRAVDALIRNYILTTGKSIKEIELVVRREEKDSTLETSYFVRGIK